MEGQARGHRQGQRDRRRDRDRQVAGRAAVAVRRCGQRAARARGHDGRRRYADHHRRRRHRRTRRTAARRHGTGDPGPVGDRHPRRGRGRRAGPDRWPRTGRTHLGAGRLRPQDHHRRAASPQGCDPCERLRRDRSAGRADLDDDDADPGAGAVGRGHRRVGTGAHRRRRLERQRREGARQAAGPQAGQGPRRRPDHPGAVRRRWRRHPRRRGVRGSRWRAAAAAAPAYAPPLASARPASRSRGCGR